jgi:hypothetical protein
VAHNEWAAGADVARNRRAAADVARNGWLRRALMWHKLIGRLRMWRVVIGRRLLTWLGRVGYLPDVACLHGKATSRQISARVDL